MTNFNINNNANSMMNSIFSSLGNSNAFGSSMLSDYAAIKNGSYQKAAKKFYSDSAAVEKTQKSIAAGKTNQAISSYKKNMPRRVTVNSDTMVATGDALSSLGNLMSEKLYEKPEDVAASMEKFVKDYNKVIDTLGESEGNNNSLELGVRMVNQTKVYEKSLNNIGISIEDNNHLKLDTEALKNANVSDVKSLFTGVVSFAKNTQSRMMQIYSAESASQTTVQGLYNNKATNEFSVGSMFDYMF